MKRSEFDREQLAAAVTYRDTLMPGDLGYMIYLHGKLYAEESGYSLEFEGYVAKTFYEFVQHFDRDADKIWLALYEDEIVGCIAVLKRPDNDAQLRWFLVHPVFRGTGIGKKLFDMALAYGRARFNSIYLMTADTQQKAISMYREAGFALTSSVEMVQWGMTLREERYDLKFRHEPGRSGCVPE